MPRAEGFENLLGLAANGIAIIRFDARFNFKGDAAVLAWLNPHVQV
jgi:hypothetical protein